MFGGSSKALALAGLVAAVAVAGPSYAQSNPFVPSSGPSKAEIEKMMDQRFKALEERLAKSGAANPPGGPTGAAPGAPVGAPVGAVPGAPVSGAGVPGGMAPPGVPGAPGVPGVMEAPKSAYEVAQDGGVRFIGCINGEPKFAQKSGLRVQFTAKDIREAQKAGIVPQCQ